MKIVEENNVYLKQMKNRTRNRCNKFLWKRTISSKYRRVFCCGLFGVPQLKISKSPPKGAPTF